MGIRTPYGVLALKGYGYGEATGGTLTSITVSSQAYTLLSFTANGSLVVSKAGLFDVLMVAGGGGGGTAANYGGGGGGEFHPVRTAAAIARGDAGDADDRARLS